MREGRTANVFVSVLAIVIGAAALIALGGCSCDMNTSQPGLVGPGALAVEAEAPQGPEDTPPPAGMPFERGYPNYFSGIEGTGLAYHMTPVYETPIWIETGGWNAWASSTREFSEPAGLQTMKGTDTISFKGTLDRNRERLTGDYTYTMEAVSTGGDSEPIYHRATLRGRIDAPLEPGPGGKPQTGTLKGTYEVGSGFATDDIELASQPASWTFVLAFK